MTTSTIATKTETPDELLAALRQSLDKMLDPLDVPGTWTQRQKDAHEVRRRETENVIHQIASHRDLLVKPTARRDAAEQALATLRDAKKAIEQQIEAAGDWRTVPEAKARDAAWERIQALTASLVALQEGVGLALGQPALPTPLRALLTPAPCESCGRPHDVFWPGSIPSLEAEITEQSTKINEHEQQLARLVEDARALLAS